MSSMSPWNLLRTGHEPNIKFFNINIVETSEQVPKEFKDVFLVQEDLDEKLKIK